MIEGWVQPEGRHQVLTVAVREASTGREVDSISVRLQGDYLACETKQELATQLEDLLRWIDIED